MFIVIVMLLVIGIAIGMFIVVISMRIDFIVVGSIYVRLLK